MIARVCDSGNLALTENFGNLLVWDGVKINTALNKHEYGTARAIHLALESKLKLSTPILFMERMDYSFIIH